MIIWQADLQDINLHRVNFADCKFANSSLNQNFGGVQAISFSPKQDLFAVGDTIGDIRLFRLEDRQPYLYFEGHGKDLMLVTDLAFSPDGQMLASSSIDSTIEIWNTDTGECLKTFTGKQQWIWAIAFSPDGRYLASGSADTTIKIWNVETGECNLNLDRSLNNFIKFFHDKTKFRLAFLLPGTIVYPPLRGAFQHSRLFWFYTAITTNNKPNHFSYL